MSVLDQLTDVLIGFGISPVDYPSIVPYMLQTPNQTTVGSRVPQTNGVRTLIMGTQRALANLGRSVGLTGEISDATHAALQEMVGLSYLGASWAVIYTALANRLRKRKEQGIPWGSAGGSSSPLSVPWWAWAALGLGVVYVATSRR